MMAHSLHDHGSPRIFGAGSHPRPVQAVAWYASCGFACPAQHNPADFFADLVAIDHRSPAAEEESKHRVALLVERFSQRQQQALEAEQVGVQVSVEGKLLGGACGGKHGLLPWPPTLQAGVVAAEDQAAMEQINDRPSFPNSLPVEFGLLLRRAWKQQSRDRLPQVHRTAWP